MPYFEITQCTPGVFEVKVDPGSPPDLSDPSDAEEEQDIAQLVADCEALWQGTMTTSKDSLLRLAHELRQWAPRHQSWGGIARCLSEVEADSATVGQLRLPIAGVCVAMLAAATDPFVALDCIHDTRRIMMFHGSDLRTAAAPWSSDENAALLHICAEQVAQMSAAFPALRQPLGIQSDQDLQNYVKVLAHPLPNSSVAAPSVWESEGLHSSLLSPPSTQEAITNISAPFVMSSASLYDRNVERPAPASYLPTPDPSQNTGGTSQPPRLSGTL